MEIAKDGEWPQKNVEEVDDTVGDKDIKNWLALIIREYPR